MQTTKIFKTAWLFAVLSIAGWATTQAANIAKLDTASMATNTVNWVTAPGGADVGEFGATPSAVNLAAMTLDGNNVTLAGLLLDNNMSGPLTIASGSILTLGASGIDMSAANQDATFNCAITLSAGHTWNVPVGRTLTIGGALTFPTGKILTVTNGGSLSVSGINTGNGTGGTLIVGNVSYTGTDINIQKTGSSTTTVPTAASPFSAPVNAGFYVNGSGTTVSLGTLEVSTGNGGCSGRVDAGAVTVSGAVTIGRSTSGSRGTYFQVNGGSFTATNTVNGVVLSPNNGAVVNLSEFYVAAGTATVGQMVFGASADTVGGTGFLLVKGGNLYVGSGGIAKSNTISAYAATVSLFSGLLGATADWTCPLPVAMSGSVGTPFTIRAADASSVAYNISLSGAVSGSGSIAKTGGGTLLLSATNTYTGSTLVNAGRLVLDVNGSVASSKIIVGSGATFDVSAVTGGFVLTNQTLSGSGVVTGAVSVASGATINPGSNTLSGTLSFSNSVTEAGGLSGAINHFDLSGAPSPANDLAIIAGDLNVSATNTVDIFGTSLVNDANYILIQYGGNLNGSITNFALSISSPAGTLSNDVTGKTISFIPQTPLRGPTNIVWIGNPVNTNWDNVTADTNWLNASSGELYFFVAGDSVQFTDAGASNSPVNIVGVVQPASILVNSQSNYVFASTSGGWIGGVASLTVTNTGTLTVLTTNTYSGDTTIDGGSTLVAAQVSSAGLPSAIGEGNLIINNGTFSYTGPSASVNLGATLGAASSVINVASGTLTLGGNLTGLGALTKTGNGQLTLNGAANYIGGTLITAGTIRANPASGIGPNALTLNGGASNAATFRFAGDAQTVSGLINVVGTNNFITTGGNDTLNKLTGTGTVQLEQSGTNQTLTLQSIDTTGFNGAFSADTLAFLRFFPTSGTTLNASNALFDLGPGTNVLFNRDGGNYSLGALAGGESTQVRGSANSGSTATTYYIGGKNVNSTFAGVIRTGTGGTGASVNIVKVGIGTLTLSGLNTYTGSTTVSNGVLALSNNIATSSDGAIDNSANITIVAGAAIDVTGRSDGSFKLNSAQTLQGNGTVNGILDAQGGGTISPGGGKAGGTGTLTVTGNIYLGPSPGADWMKLNRAASPNSDRLVSSTGGIYHFGEDLIVTNIGAPLQVNDTFTLFSGPSSLNQYNSIILPGYYVWDTSQLNVNGSITVTGVLSHPSVTSADFGGLAGGSITLNATNGIPGTTVKVLASTNLALPLRSWTTVTNTTFDANGNLMDPDSGNPGLTIQVDPAQTPRFYLLQTFGY